MATITSASKAVIKIRQPCSTPGCKGTSGEMVNRKDLNSKGYITGMKVHCSKCHRRMAYDRTVRTRDEQDRGYRGRSVTDIKKTQTMEQMGCRSLSREEIDAIAHTIDPPCPSKDRIWRN